MIAIGVITKDNNNLQYNTTINEKEKTLTQIKILKEKIIEKKKSVLQKQESLVKLTSKVNRCGINISSFIYRID